MAYAKVINPKGLFIDGKLHKEGDVIEVEKLADEPVNLKACDRDGNDLPEKVEKPKKAKKSEKVEKPEEIKSPEGDKPE